MLRCLPQSGGPVRVIQETASPGPTMTAYPHCAALPRIAEDPGDAPRRQLRLRQESGRRALGDQLRIVRLGARRDQDHVSADSLTVLGQEPARSKPLSSPSPMSTRMTSGLSTRACWSASAMLEATPTTVKPSRSRRKLAVSRKASLSSTSYLAFVPFHPWALAALIGLSALAVTLLGRSGDSVTAAITTAVVMVAAELAPAARPAPGRHRHRSCDRHRGSLDRPAGHPSAA